jgi:anti-sigma B factor antagonist
LARLPRFLRRAHDRDDAASEPAGPPPGLEVRVEEEGDTVRLELVGELDIDTRLSLKGALARAEAAHPETIVVDLRRLEFMDSMGLGVLLGALRRSRTGGWRLVLVKGPEPIEQLLLITGVKNLVEMVDEPDAEGDGGGNGTD